VKRLLPIALLVALAGGALWFFKLRHDTESGAVDPAPKPVEKVAAGSGSGSAKKPDAPRTGDMGGELRVQIDDDPKGSELLEGQVIDAEDRPVAGATVVLSSNPPRTTKSNDDGSFSFDQLVIRPYTLVARAKDGVAGPVTARLSTKSDPVILRLRAGSKLAVTVVDQNQKPIAKATVELRSIEERRELTDGKGVATFTNTIQGGYQIAAWADGMAKTFQWIGVGEGNEETKIVLQAGAKVAGRVVDEAGAGIPGAIVRFSGASDWSQQGDSRLDAAMSGADGAFEFPALQAGSFRFIGSHPSYAPGTSRLVTLDGKTTSDGVIVTMGRGAIVKGRVIDQAKQPVASARVRVGVAARGMIFEAPRQAYSDASGAFEIRGLPRKALAAVAMHESGASQTIQVDTTSGDAEIELVVDVTGSISGSVVDPTGNPLEGVQVSAGPNFGDSRTAATQDFTQWRLRGFPEELTDAAGKFTLTGLAKGSYTISASPARAAGRGRRFMGGSGTPLTAETGDANVKIVLPPEGSVKGKVQFADGKAPTAYTVSIGMTQQSYAGSEFLLADLPPRKYELTVRGPSFQTRVVEITVESSKVADAGTITVEAGRMIGGVVLADGNPVEGATVHVGRLVFGNGSTSNANFGPMGQGTKHDTTDASGKFMISGFPQGDITIVAEHDSIGRSRAIRLPTVMPGQQELTLALEKFGALTGVLTQGGKPSEGVFVSCQSTTTPGAIYSVSSGPDGSYRFDKLAPDVYKVSATLGMPMMGMKFYSKQVDVPSGREVKVDLTVEPGTVTVDVAMVSSNGKPGVASVYIAQGAITARTADELALKMAAAGPGASQWIIVRDGEPAKFTEVAPGTYSACAAPFPAEVRGFSAMGYGERHSDSLPAFCKPFVVQPSPATQTVSVPVTLPPFIPESTGSGSGSGSGSAPPPP